MAVRAESPSAALSSAAPWPRTVAGESLHAATTSLCSTCLARVPAAILLRRGQVVLRKDCTAHGVHDELLEEDAAFFLRGAEYDRPGTDSRRQTESRRGCPYDCGLCPQHRQHTCIGLLEVTPRCDLACPVCYADAGTGGFLPLETAARMVDAYQEAEGGKADVLQVSGGEPTLHPRILDILRMARDRGVRYVMLNTNGLRIARDRAFAAALAEFAGGFEVYLQFDGLDPRATRTLRGRDLVLEKLRALDNLAEHGVPATLVTTVHGGVNDHEIGRIVEFGMKHPTVRGINFQPAAFFGRLEGLDPAGRITRTGVLRRLERQTAGMVRVDDFVPLPCDVDRAAITLLYRDREEFVPLTRKADVRGYLSFLDNTLAFYPQDLLKRAAAALCGGSGGCACMSLVKDALPFVRLGGRALVSRDRPAFTTRSLFRITVTAFLDRFTFELGAMRKECVHVLTPDGRRIPFSAYNLFHRSGGPVGGD